VPGTRFDGVAIEAPVSPSVAIQLIVDHLEHLPGNPATEKTP
jgi:hypothetical protein